MLNKTAQAGTLESNDIMITAVPAEPGSGIIIDLESNVLAQYGPIIRNVIRQAVQACGIADVYIKALDRGALDCTIRARTAAALYRGGAVKGAGE